MESSASRSFDPRSLSETAALIQGARAGDEAARGALLERFEPLLEGFLHARLPAAARDLLDTQDLAQEVSLRALANLKRFEDRGVGAFWAYLRGIGRNLLIDHARRVRPLPRADVPLEEQGRTSAATPLDSLVREEELACFEASLEVLDERKRRAVLARLELGLPFEWIAGEEGFDSADAARMAVTRAIRTLAEEMERRGV